MASPIQELFPSFVTDLNTIYSNLKDKDGFIGVDVSYENSPSTPRIRIIIEGIDTNETQNLVSTYNQLIGEETRSKIFWQEITKEFREKENRPQANPKKSDLFKTIKPGINIGNGTSFGTLGLICRDINTRQTCMLTAYHVAKRLNLYQPSPSLEENLIGDFLRYDPFGDSAVYSFNVSEARFNRNFNGAGIMFNNNIINSSISIKTTEFPKLGGKLNKIGVVTNKTSAIIKGIGIYRHERVGEVIWVEGFWLIPEDPQNPEDIEISFKGDSGSIWYNAETEAGVGLQIAGDRIDSPPIQEFAIAQHLINVLEKLRIQLI